MTLEIHVEENVHVIDLVPGGEDIGVVIELLEKIIQDFIDGEAETITITLVKGKGSRSPPTLQVNVKDGIKVGEALS